MRNLFYSERLADGHELCIAPVSRDAFEANQAYDLGDDHGYFVYEFNAADPATGIEILAKAASYEAAARLMDIYAMVAKRGSGAASAV